VFVRVFTFKIFCKHQYHSQSRNSLTFVTPEDPPPCSLDFDAGLYPETDYSSPHSHSYLFKIHIGGPIILQPKPLLAGWFFPFGYSN
jgi:hypothetical protein